MATVWTFRTDRFTVQLDVSRDHGYIYDGDDEDGSIQADLDRGELVAFTSFVTVEDEDGTEIGADCLGGSVYRWNEAAQFWTAHRGLDPMDRNCSIMRAERGNVSICHYFPDMVRAAIQEARTHMSAGR